MFDMNKYRAMFEEDRKTGRETVNAWREARQALENLQAVDYIDGKKPAETVAGFVAQVGYETARFIVASLINEAAWDGRISSDCKAWAAGIESALDSETARHADVFAHSMHKAHLNQIARAMMDYKPEPETVPEGIPAEELENALEADAAEEIAEEIRAAGPVVVREFTTKTKSYRVLDVFGYEIPVEISKTGKPGRLEKDARRVFELLAAGPEKLTPSERLELLRIYNVAFHESGKIEGIFSLDSSATNCGFCRKMREYAAAHPEKKCICGSCYDVRQEGFKLAALARHTLNLIIMSATVYSREELATVPVYGLTRINSSGDSSGDIYAENMVLFAAAHPACRVTAWAKNTAGYIRACRKHGKPENLLLICSSPFIDKTAPLPEYFDYTFTVYSTPEKIREALAAGAMECNGKKCRECGYSCYTGAWPEGSNIAELLRK